MWAPPDGVELEGETYRINTDFRAGIAYYTALTSGEPVRADSLLRLFFPEQRPPQEAALAAISDFLRCGEEAAEEQSEDTAVSVMPYSYVTDADALVAEFQRVYGIDLTTADMHWWRFRALLRGLLAHSFSERVKYRTCDPQIIKDKETRRQWVRLKETYALGPDGLPVRRPKTVEEYNEMLLAQARGERW